MRDSRDIALLALAVTVGMTAAGCQKRKVEVRPNEIPSSHTTTPTPPPPQSSPTPGDVPPPTGVTPTPGVEGSGKNPGTTGGGTSGGASSGGQQFRANPPRVRLIHGVAGAPPVDIYLSDRKVASGLQYKTSSAYVPISGANVSARITPAGASTNLINPTDLTFRTPGSYTVIASGSPSASSLQAIVLTDDTTQPAADAARVRLVHAADAPAVDVLVNQRMAITGLSSGRATGAYAQWGAGTYRVTLVPVGADKPALGPVPLELKAGGVYTLVVLGSAANRTLNLQAFEDR